MGGYVNALTISSAGNQKPVETMQVSDILTNNVPLCALSIRQVRDRKLKVLFERSSFTDFLSHLEVYVSSEIQKAHNPQPQ